MDSYVQLQPVTTRYRIRLLFHPPPLNTKHYSYGAQSVAHDVCLFMMKIIGKGLSWLAASKWTLFQYRRNAIHTTYCYILLHTLTYCYILLQTVTYYIQEHAGTFYMLFKYLRLTSATHVHQPSCGFASHRRLVNDISHFGHGSQRNIHLFPLLRIVALFLIPGPCAQTRVG